MKWTDNADLYIISIDHLQSIYMMVMITNMFYKGCIISYFFHGYCFLELLVSVTDFNLHCITNVMLDAS